MHRPLSPLIPPEARLADLNGKTVFVGLLFGVLFGSANAYLGLRVGLTISTSIPLAVMSVAFFRLLSPLVGRSTLLESNLTQTVGSASSSLASGLIFTIPALFLWGYDPPLLQIAALAMGGGLLGVLFMIPLRRFLIVQAHSNLPYPEGRASAEVLIAADRGGARAGPVFWGLGVGAIHKALVSLFRLWPGSVRFSIPFLPKAEIGMALTPALLGVGYILGIRIAAVMVGGGLLSWVGLIPLMASHFKDHAITPSTLAYLQAKGLDPSVKTMGGLSPHQLWEGYIRIIGAGAVASAGLITVAKSLPMMIESLRVGLGGFHVGLGKGSPDVNRTERDLPIGVVAVGVFLVFLALGLVPGILGGHIPLTMRWVAGFFVTFFAFCFVTVSSRIVGLIGVSSNPTSGMAIVTLLGTGLLFRLVGWTDLTGKITALTVGTVVCIAASIAGDISQDLKTGFLIGATPQKQQIGEMVGAVGTAFFIALALISLGRAYGFGTPDLPAPQATLMKTILDGVMEGNLRWDLVAIGASLTLIVASFRIPPLPFAVGMYLPLETMTPVFCGGLLRLWVERRRKTIGATGKGEDRGILLGSGYIAGEGLMGVILACWVVLLSRSPEGVGVRYPHAWMGAVVSFMAFLGLGWFLFRTAIRSFFQKQDSG